MMVLVLYALLFVTHVHFEKKNSHVTSHFRLDKKMDDDRLRRNTGSHFALHFIYISYTLLVDVVVVLNGFVV